MIARLADAMARLEYNLAVQLALNGKHIESPNVIPFLIENMRGLLRAPIPVEDQ
jgi:hypothetical protein